MSTTLPTKAALLSTLSALTSLLLPGCWDAPTTCASGADCFVGEACIAQRCVADPNMGQADMSTTLDMTQDRCANTSCPADQRCDPSTGQCTSSGCAPGTHLCQDQCLPDDAVSSCGDRCQPCPGADDGSGSCVQGQCVLSCPQGSLQCDDQCAPCPAGADPDKLRCQASQCVEDTCPAGSLSCDGQCAACPEVANAEFSCEGAQCVVSQCQTGFKSCDGACAACPAQDPRGQLVCQGATCQLQCDGGTLACGDACAPCPAPERVLSFGCEAATQRCVATDCVEGYTPCDQGCCALMPPSSGPVLMSANAAHLGISTTLTGMPRIVFDDKANNAKVRLLSYDGQGQWTNEEVASGIAAGNESIAIDPQGQAHIAYLTNNLRTVNYAYKTANSWQVEKILDVPDSREDTSLSLKLDGQNNLHIAVANNNDVLFASRQANGTWRQETVFNSDGTKRGVSLAFYQDQPRVAFRTAYTTANIRYARRINNRWDSQRISDLREIIRAQHVSMLVVGTPFIFMDDDLSKQLKLYTINNNTWQSYSLTQPISGASLEQEGMGNAVFAPNKNLLYVVYHLSTAGQAALLSIAGSNVQSTNLGAIAPNTRPAIFADPSGAAHITFVRTTQSGAELYYDYRN